MTNFTEIELANLRNNLRLVKSQVNAERLDGDFLVRQLDKLDDLLLRVAELQAQRSQAHRFEALYNVSRVLGSSLDLQTVLDQVMDAIIQLTGAERGFLMLRDDDGGLTVQAARNLDQQTIGSDDFRYSRTVANQVIDSGMPILTTNATEDPRFAGTASIVAQSLRSIMASPLRVRGSVIGVAYVDSQATAGLFHESDLDALDAFSSQAAMALDNAILFAATDEALSSRIDQLRQLRRVDLQLSETLDADRAKAITLEWACRLAGASGGYLGLVERDALHSVDSYGVVDRTITSLTETFPACHEVMRSGQTVNAGDTLLVPIRRETDVVGVVVLVDGQPFSEEQQDMVERVVARAAVSIENARLYAAVRDADKAKSEFVGIVAHDLKSPMTGIKGYADLMLMLGDLNEQQIEYLGHISNTVERMQILVSDLADISRIESGHFFMDEITVSVEGVVQAVKDSVLPQITAHNHQFVEDIVPGLPDLWVDYYRLLQILINLISNAYKYTPDGGTITFRAYQDGDRVCFVVEDTGIGMSAEQIAKLGTKFWRADDQFIRSQPGTGLGFSITQSLVEQMGSRVEIESTVGQGSKFSFSVAIANASFPFTTSG
jgi:signal transduction histidine kinase